VGKDQIDERNKIINIFIEKFQSLSQQHQKWFYIAACECDQEYDTMMQTVTKESERKWLAEIREIYRSQEKVQKKAANPHADQSKGLTAQNTAGTGRCGDYTTAPRQIQGGI